MTAALQPSALDVDNETYDLFRELVLERTGIQFGPRRRSELSRGVLAASARVCDADLNGYADRLRATDTNSVLWDDLIAEISIGETYFFRDESHMLALRTVILPALIARHQADRTLRIWSAGCSTGEEAYSIAMLLVDLLEDPDRWNLLILATDINRRAISQAAKGRYREWSFRTTDTRYRARHFTASQDGLFELRPEIRRMVAYGYLNLATSAYPSPVTLTNALDLILWRNVGIYLPQPVVRTVARRLHECLLPGGYLIVGATEVNAVDFQEFTALPVCGATVFQKTLRPPVSEGVVDKVAPPESSHKAPIPPERPAQELPVVRPAPLPPVPIDPRPAYEEGPRLQRAGKTEAAMAVFDACLATQPAFAPAHHALARVYANRGDLREARRLCERAIECDPGLAEAHHTLALICVESGTEEEAVGCLRKALYLEPEFALAHYSLSNILERAGSNRDAARHRRHAIRVASALAREEVVTGSDDLTAGQLRAMLATAAGADRRAGTNHG